MRKEGMDDRMQAEEETEAQIRMDEWMREKKRRIRDSE